MSATFKWGENKFSSPFAPFETHSKNRTLCAANILVLPVLLKRRVPATLHKYAINCSERARTHIHTHTQNKFLFDSCELKKIAATYDTTNERTLCWRTVRDVAV
jgi:hypothetical protein